MTFNNQLHEDLYGLFIFSFLKYDISDANEEQFRDTKETSEFELIESLFPQEHCPEQYERWVSDVFMSTIKHGNNQSPVKDEYYCNKVRINVE